MQLAGDLRAAAHGWLGGSANGQQNGQGGVVSGVVRFIKFVPALGFTQHPLGSLYVTIALVNHQIKELLLEDGDSPFGQWFGSLQAVAAAKVRVAVGRMEQATCLTSSGFGALASTRSIGGLGCASTWPRMV